MFFHIQLKKMVGVLVPEYETVINLLSECSAVSSCIISLYSKNIALGD